MYSVDGLEEIYVQRWFGGIPRYDETHLAIVADVATALPEDIAVVGAWVGGVGVPAVITQARVVAQQLR